MEFASPLSQTTRVSHKNTLSLKPPSFWEKTREWHIPMLCSPFFVLIHPKIWWHKIKFISLGQIKLHGTGQLMRQPKWEKIDFGYFEKILKRVFYCRFYFVWINFGNNYHELSLSRRCVIRIRQECDNLGVASDCCHSCYVFISQVRADKRMPMRALMTLRIYL